jgi:16S rRNA (cytidine1402-2'-O)-methyltransferase
MVDALSPGILWIVATPIGSLEDLPPRARQVLGAVDLILAEDTRRTRKLLSHADIPSRGRLRSFHEHNERTKIEWVLSELEGGSDIALVSDAGTPALSDPGFQLVRAVRQSGREVRSVPGASAFSAALAAAGQPPLPAGLVGFLPAKSGPRRRRIAELECWQGTVVILLSPHRLARELGDLAAVLGPDREATLMAEISKRHERALMASLGDLAASREAGSPRGEYVVVIGPPVAEEPTDLPSPDAAKRAYDEAIADGSDRPSALRQASKRLGLSRRELYALLLDHETTD